MVFLQALKFHNSTVQVGTTTEPFMGATAPGHLGEAQAEVEQETEQAIELNEENILAAKPRRFAEAYSKSTLFKVFDELTKEAVVVP
jgi:hypothetical protein